MIVGLVDYGAGNMFSILCGLRRAGMNVVICKTPQELKTVDALVIPGVGNFSEASVLLRAFKPSIEKAVSDDKYLLGICLGMQILLERSEEGMGDGLGLIKGEVKRLPKSVKVPHVGWNTIDIKEDIPIFEGLSQNPHFYFVHSYASILNQSSDVIATTEYGIRFSSAIQWKTILGFQFHPEKSGQNGEIILDNFRRMMVR